MESKQQKHIRKQAAVRTQPAPPVKRIETTPEAEQAAREARRKKNAEIDARRRGAAKAAKGGDTPPAGKAANAEKEK